MLESIPLIVAILSFGTVSAVAFLVGQYVLAQSRIQRRLSLPMPASTRTRARPTQDSGCLHRQAFRRETFRTR
jgi:hypothetical protein